MNKSSYLIFLFFYIFLFSVMTTGESNEKRGILKEDSMVIRGVIIDLFGVLFKDRWKEWKHENEEKLRQFATSSPPFTELGLRPSYPEYYTDLIRLNTDEKPQHGKPLIDDDKFYEILEKASGKPAESIKGVIHDTTVLNNDVLSLAYELKRNGYKVGLITNGDTEITEEFLKAHNLGSQFDAVVVSAEVGKKKPHPFIFHKMASCLKLSLDELLLIDDSHRAIAEVKKLGVKGIHYDNQTIQKLKDEIKSIGLLFS